MIDRSDPRPPGQSDYGSGEEYSIRQEMHQEKYSEADEEEIKKELEEKEEKAKKESKDEPD